VLTDANNCEDTDQITITVNPLPAINAGADDAVCIGNAYTLTATGGTSYTWNNSLGAGASHSVSPTATTTYEVTGTDANGCVNTDQIVITVNALPIVNAGTDQTSCAGTSVTISATGASTYNWTGLGAGATQSFTASTTATYVVTGTDGNNCVNTDNVVITVNPSPTINAGADQAICNGEQTTITATGGNT
jgi:hypothetical protein